VELTLGEKSKRILFVALKKEAQPVLGELRGLGHGVSLVEDIDEATVLLSSGGFDQAVLPAPTLSHLLEQRALWQSNDTDNWRRAIAGLAHDIEYLLQSLRRGIVESGDQAEARETVRTISVLAHYLSELSGEMDAARGQDLRLSIIDLEEAVETAAITVYPSAAERRQRLVIDIEDESASVRADPVKLKRILATLLDYASRNTPSNGTVMVRAYLEQEEPVICISYPGEEMSGREVQQLFSPETDREPASGLSRVQRLLEQHGCRLWLESERGVSTDLFLALPRWAHVKVEPGSFPVRI
jgi:signal transduction histidine kinase